MKLINKSARLITINAIVNDKTESYVFMPAAKESTEMPDSVANGVYVKALRKNGDLDVVSDDEESESDPTDELREEAKSLGIDVDKRWGDERLMEEIVKAQEK